MFFHQDVSYCGRVLGDRIEDVLLIISFCPAPLILSSRCFTGGERWRFWTTLRKQSGDGVYPQVAGHAPGGRCGNTLCLKRSTKGLTSRHVPWMGPALID